MRSALALLAVMAGCGTLDANWRPSIMPKLSQLPREAHHRDAILDHTSERARPEQRRSLTAKERKVETTAALMAALIGHALSKSSTVMFGVATDIEENHLFERPAQKKKPGSVSTASETATDPATGDTPPASRSDAGERSRAEPALVPWVRLGP